MLLFLLLVFLPVVPIETEVVRTLADCPGFFLDETPPVIPNILVGGNILNQNRYKVICQTFRNMTRFLTLYDTKNKIPVFSAYRFTGVTETGRPNEPWKIEPQLENGNNITEFQDINMRQLDGNMTNLEHYNQALKSDYNNSQDYDKGHLYPSCHAPDMEAKRSTFTLTNVVPQSQSFNGGRWAQMERNITFLMGYYCNATGRIEAFVVVGAEPGEEKLNNKINIPSRMWSAFCCYNKTDDVWLSKAYWGHNLPWADVTESSYEEIRANFNMIIFPESLCSFQSDMDPSKKKYCEDSTPTAPPTTKDETSETPTTVITTQKMTTTLPTTTKTTQTITSTTTKSTPMNQQCSSFSIQENEDRTETEGEVFSSKNVQNVDSQGCHNLPFFQNSCEEQCESSRADLCSGG